MKARLLRECTLVLLALVWSGSAWSAPFQLISQRAGEPPAGGSGDSWGAIISPDGRFVLFASTANNLVLTTNGHPLPIVGAPRLNVFIRDRTNGTTTLVSANLAGTGGGNGDSIPTALSTNGQFACFESRASDLIAGDTNGVADVFVRDLVNNTTLLVSAATNGGVGNGVCRRSVMTPDGRYVAFVSAANSLVPDDTNNIPDIFLRDLLTGTTTLASVGARSTNAVALSSSESPEITPDGRYVAFYSSATNLVPEATQGGEIYVRDLVAGVTIWASTNSRAILATNAISYNHAISSDGHYITFETSAQAPLSEPSNFRSGYVLRFNMLSGATDVVSTNAFAPPQPLEEINNLDMTPDGRFIAFIGNTNGTSGATNAVYLWDGQSGVSTLVSGDLSGKVPTSSVCDSPKMDSTGRFVAFLSSATNIVTNGLAGDYHLYLRDTLSNLTTLLDADTNGIGSSVIPATIPRLSDNGGFVAFESLDASLVANDRNRDYDLFVRDISGSNNELISARDSALGSVSPNNSSLWSGRGVVANGLRIAFASDADNVIDNDTNGFRDVFVRDLLSGTNILVSVATNGLPGDNISYEPSISLDGRFVAFTSSADNLVPGDSNKREDVFLRDLSPNTTALVSANLSGTATGNQGSHVPTVSADGRSVIFQSSATDLASGSFTGENLFVRDLSLGVTYALTTNGVGSSAATPDGRFVAFALSSGSIYVWDTKLRTRVYTNASSGTVSGISRDGNRIAYVSGAAAYVWDRAAHTYWLVSALGLGFSSLGFHFNAMGDRLVYRNVINLTNQIYLSDFQNGTNLLISRNASLLPANGRSDSPDISPDGRFVVYRSFANDIVSFPPNNGAPNLFLYDSLTDSNSLLTASAFQSGYPDNRSAMPSFSGDGRMLVFQSFASDLVGGDFNHNGDVLGLGFLYASVAYDSDLRPIITWLARPGESYHVQFKDVLTDINWQEVSGTVTITGSQAQLTDLAPTGGQRFYKVVGY
jgi:Tol biopolymer transport system component